MNSLKRQGVAMSAYSDELNNTCYKNIIVILCFYSLDERILIHPLIFKRKEE